jgi:hypothetical protein
VTDAMRSLGTVVLGALLLVGCATHPTLAELEADPRDSLTVQQTHPKMLARPDTTVGEMRADFRECASRPRDSASTARDVLNQVSDLVVLGVAVPSDEGPSRTLACMRDKGYTQAVSR